MKLFDNLQKAKKTFFNRELPNWPGLEMGLTLTEGTVQTSRYCDFLQPGTILFWGTVSG